MSERVIGILGVGHLAGFLLEGLRSGGRQDRVVLSPRGKAKAAALAERFAAEVAPDNQAVIDACDVILVSLPAASGRGILSDLKFRAGQTVLSAMAGTSSEELLEIVTPASAHCTMMPGYANALGIGPSLLYPANEVCEELLGRLGPVHIFEDKGAFEAACVFGAFSGASFVFMQRIVAWFEAQGVPADVARNLVAETLRGNAEVVRTIDQPLDSIVEGIATAGGITWQCVDALDGEGALASWSGALDAVNARMKRGMD
ncbi:NAD(P)-binding domain-containing protein [Pelagibius sp. Alg239-R121]|uniref:NAD(P)-binding domain-containing protein n=1 Tax=Pelagibius sp. Alg239-R121 TaxID=2993448 RepID=UPI0024A61FD9|nr:NAD(P)-binding domain-containing protein [Pelagibius sp. Alg239-R121]